MNAMRATSILIVEDKGLIAELLQEFLTDLGYDASAIATSSEEALACIAHKCPDVILVDVQLARSLDGIQTASLLKQKCAATVIYLTGHADTVLIKRAKRTTPQGYLIKPFKDAELRSTIEIALYNRQLNAERIKRLVTEHRLSIIPDNIPIAVAYFDGKGKVQFANRVFRELVPYQDNPIGVAAITFLGDELCQRSFSARQRDLLGEAAGSIVDIEQSGVTRHHEVTYIADHDLKGEVCGVDASSSDITERDRLSAALRIADQDLETLLDAVPARIASWHRDLTFRFANRAARRHYEVPDGVMKGMHMRDVIGVARFEEIAPYIAKALAGDESIFELTDSADGSIRYICHYLIPERKGPAVVGMYALAFDVTDLRESHESVRRLAQGLETVREDERRSVATMLHDGIAQDLFAARLEVDAMAAAHPKDFPPLCRALSTALTRCMDDTRQLTHSLHPVALSRYGVGAAIVRHARYFAEQSRLVITVNCSARLPPLSDAAQLLLFRAAQEALTNVARHAHARMVAIKLWSGDGQVWLKITDDGVGIPEDALLKAESLGLLALRERFSAGGGSMTIVRGRPTGTVVMFKWPYKD